MWIFYALSFIPIVIGSIVFAFNKKIHVAEWVSGLILSLIVSVLFHGAAFSAATADYQTLSATVEGVTFYPEWVEQYTDTETETYMVGKEVKTRTKTVTKYRTHHEYWTCTVPHFNSEPTISQARFNELKRTLGGRVETTEGWKSGFVRGDKNIYKTHNTSKEIIPYMITSSFQNRVKASPSLFRYHELKDTSHLPEYPYTNDNFKSNRLLGRASSDLSLDEWDKLNAVLGKNKKINIIVVGFDVGSSVQDSIDLETFWFGGKKNDLVIVYGGNNNKVVWSRVFGWTEEELVKRNIESILLKDGLNGLAKKVEQEVINHYKIKDWSKFDYISVEPSRGWIIGFIIIQVIFQTGLWVFFHFNEIDCNRHEVRPYNQNQFRKRF